MYQENEVREYVEAYVQKISAGAAVAAPSAGEEGGEEPDQKKVPVNEFLRSAVGREGDAADWIALDDLVARWADAHSLWGVANVVADAAESAGSSVQ